MSILVTLSFFAGLAVGWLILAIVLGESLKPIIRGAISIVSGFLFVLGMLRWTQMLFSGYNSHYDSRFVARMLFGFLCGIVAGAASAISERFRGK